MFNGGGIRARQRTPAMKAIFRSHPTLMSAFVLAAALTLFFAGRFTLDLIYWSGHEREPVRPWMTVGYVARSWDLHGPDIDSRAGLPRPEGRPLTLDEIAAQRGVPVDEIIAQVEAAVTALVAERAAGPAP